MDPIEERDKRWSFGTLLRRSADAMQEQHLSKAQALQLLHRMLGRAEQPPSVVSAIQRLESADENQFELVFGKSRWRALTFKIECPCIASPLLRQHE